MLNYRALISFLSIFCLTIFSTIVSKEESLSLRNNLTRAQTGDFIVAAQSKTYTLLHIYAKDEKSLIIEEVTVPASKIEREGFSWREWISKGAPNHTCWILYTVISATGEIQDAYSLSAYGWHSISLEDAFLPTLLNLRFQPMPDAGRKKVGDPLSEGGTGGKKIWHPQMVVDGKIIKGVLFNAWKTHWPKDRTPLSDKIIEVYFPQDQEKYPSYFPFWIQVTGAVGKADLRVVDSGIGLKSPVTAPGMKKQQNF